MIKTLEHSLLPLTEYDLIIVSYSGGKDSLAMVLHLLELGVPRSKIELWHQHVDGKPGQRGLFDWACTDGYVKASAKGLGTKLRYQWKDGGLEGEMLREESRTKGVYFEDGEGETRYLPASTRGKLTTRRMYPQTAADLSVRWCSAYVKIDVAGRAMNNDSRFKSGKYLFCTGERREESSARSKYAEHEPHRCNGKRRRVDQWRPIIDWTEQEVWEIIERAHVYAHPAYYLGYGRVSCQHCIFADNAQLATNRQIDPERFATHAAYEQEFGKTIHRTLTVITRADKGEVFPEASDTALVALGMSTDYPIDRFDLPTHEEWKAPAGAYKKCKGPT